MSQSPSERPSSEASLGPLPSAVDALKVDDLALRRGGRRIAEAVTFEIPAGRLGILRGPNGSGKSTLLRALAGLGAITAGQVRLLSPGDAAPLTLAEDRDAYVERIAYAGHLDALKPSLTVTENLMFWARFLGDPLSDPSLASSGGGRDPNLAGRRVEAALQRFGLTSQARAPAGACSAGQKRRLGLARLAVADRPVWLLDEPTVSLDAAATASFCEMIAEHCARGGVALAATHIDLASADPIPLQMADFAPRRAATAPDLGARAGDDAFLDGGDWEPRG